MRSGGRFGNKEGYVGNSTKFETLVVAALDARNSDGAAKAVCDSLGVEMVSEDAVEAAIFASIGTRRELRSLLGDNQDHSRRILRACKRAFVRSLLKVLNLESVLVEADRLLDEAERLIDLNLKASETHRLIQARMDAGEWSSDLERAKKKAWQESIEAQRAAGDAWRAYLRSVGLGANP